MMPEYYYGAESEQFAFYRVPKIMFEAESVKDISTDAKLLYGLMLDRMQLSAKNGWVDDYGRVYIYFTVKQIMDALSCCNRTVTKLLHELEDVQLIERIRGGLTKPDRIYVMNFLSVVKKSHLLMRKKVISGDEKNSSQEVKKVHTNNTDINNTEFSDTESIESIRSDRCDAMDEYRSYEAIIRKNIEYDILIFDNHYDKDILEEIVTIMTDVMMTKGGTIRICGDYKPVEIVKNRFMKLNSGHISYVLKGLKENPVEIRNIKAYILASLYNAQTTISNYYSALVNHDMANGRI